MTRKAEGRSRFVKWQRSFAHRILHMGWRPGRGPSSQHSRRMRGAKAAK